MAEGSAAVAVAASGCLAVSLAVLGHFDRVAAADISPEALAVARRNAERNGAAVDFFQGDLFGGLPAGSTYQVLVSNPPTFPRASWRR